MKITAKFFPEYRLDWLFVNSSIFYFILPIILFIFGWMKLGYALLTTLIVVVSAVKASQQFQYKSFAFSKRLIIPFFCVAIIAAAWVSLSGIGGMGLQSWDFHGRNAILHDLISHAWPVQYDYSGQPEMAALLGEHGRLVYYFAFFLPAALFGKVFGWQAANCFLFFWALAGVLITFGLILRYLRRISIWPIVVFVFFSGMDVLAAINTSGAQVSPGTSLFASITAGLLSTSQLEWWAGNIFQYSSFTTQLFNVFNQCIPAWIITLIIIDLRDLKSIWFFYSLLLLFGPFPFIGLFPFVAFMNIKHLQLANFRLFLRKPFWIDFIANLAHNRPEWMTFQNIAGAGTIFLTSSTFLFSNAGQHEFGWIWQFQDNFAGLIFIYLVFCLLEFLILGLLINLRCQEKLLLWITLGILTLLPLFKYGEMNDLVMRASIPALLVLFLLTAQYFRTQAKNKFRLPILTIVIILVLILGSVTSLHEINRSVSAMLPSKAIPRVMDAWGSFDYGGFSDKMDSVKNFVVSDSANVPPFFYFK